MRLIPAVAIFAAWFVVAAPAVAATDDGRCTVATAAAKKRAPGWAKMLSEVNPAKVKTRAALAKLPVIRKSDLPALQTLKSLNWWHWSGGLLGAFFIATAAFAAPRTGALLFMALVLAGQLCMALLLDHFGWAGFRPAPLSPGKVAGLLLIVVGVWLIRRS